MLSIRSSYFKTMFASGMQESQNKEIELQDVRFKTMLAILEYLYSGNISLSGSNAVDIMLVRTQCSHFPL